MMTAVAIGLCVALFIRLLMWVVERIPDRKSYLGTNVGE